MRLNSEMHSHVTFRSTSFNISEPRDYFINDCCFGDDLCRWLIEALRQQGLHTDDEPGQEDFGWYFNFSVQGKPSCFVVSFQPDDLATGEQWHGWVERDCGFIASLFGGRRRKIDPESVAVIDRVLRDSPSVSDVVWSKE